MKTKLMRFITSFFESWREEKKVLANQPESIVEHTDITVVRSTNHPLAERVKTAPVSLTDQVNLNPEKRLGRFYKNQAFQKVQKRNVHEKR